MSESSEAKRHKSTGDDKDEAKEEAGVSLESSEDQKARLGSLVDDKFKDLDETIRTAMINGIAEFIETEDFKRSNDKRKLSLLAVELMALVQKFGQMTNTRIADLAEAIVDDLAKAESEKKQFSHVNHANAELAFQSDYKKSGAEEAFWKHLEEQRNAHQKASARKYPFFAVLQSSGYGKSRLFIKLQQEIDQDHPRIVYISFAAKGAFPTSNVEIHGNKEKADRRTVTNAFMHLFKTAFHARAGPQDFVLNLDDAEAPPSTSSSGKTDVLYVIDEASRLVQLIAGDGVNFFRCFRAATIKFKTDCNPQCFFVVLSTFSATSHVIPANPDDPSYKGYEDDTQTEPMATFLLHEAIGIRNDETEILERKVNDCHHLQHLLAMGRPMWKAFIDLEPKDSRFVRLLKFAQAKLFCRKKLPELSELTTEQKLAVLACRMCLTISPVSRLAKAIVGSHMATAVKISDDREEIVVSYPSEPALALAARNYMDTHAGAFLRPALRSLKAHLLSGAVAKGHRGEVIVRLLNLLAIDKAMKNKSKSEEVVEVELKDFLAQFDRKGASLSDALKTDSCEKKSLSENQIRVLTREGLLENVEETSRKEAAPVIEWKGTVCFTHFVYLNPRSSGEDPLITPDLLRYAYRRTAALVVEEGRRGIDWIIPVRVGEDEFVGLCGQDKNRMHDKLEGLLEKKTPETHYKMTAEYFLDADEKEKFKKIRWSLSWPAILFSIDASEKGAALAERATRMRLRSNKTFHCPFPCIVLTGLGYSGLVDDDSENVIRELKNAHEDLPAVYIEKVPLTCGAKSKARSEGEDPMECEDS